MMLYELDDIEQAALQGCKHGRTGYCFDCVRERHNQDMLDGLFDDMDEDYASTPHAASVWLQREATMSYLPKATDFTDMTLMSPPTGYPCKAEDAVLCPLCKGYGGWNLSLNSYPLPQGYDDTPENRSKYVHFRAHCNQCNGWGWVRADSADATCIHEYKELSVEQSQQKGIKHWGMCWHVYECSKCGHTMSQDSSD